MRLPTPISNEAAQIEQKSFAAELLEGTGFARCRLLCRLAKIFDFVYAISHRGRGGGIWRLDGATSRAERCKGYIAGRVGTGKFPCQFRWRDSYDPGDVRSCPRLVREDGVASAATLARVRATVESEAFLSCELLAIGGGSRRCSGLGDDDEFERFSVGFEFHFIFVEGELDSCI
jgi:hypothetical protein